MATPAPPISTPASSRARDWGRTGEPGSAFSGLGRGGRGGGGGGGGRGRSRGSGRGRGGSSANASAGSSTPRTPSSAPKPTASEGSTTKPTPSKPAATTSGSTSQKPVVSPSTPATPARAKGHSRKTSRSVVPTVVVGPSTPSAEAPAAAPRPSNRRRRSQQLNSKGGGNAAALKVNVPSLDDNLLRPQNRLVVPHSAPLPSKDAPPHLAGSFDMRNNIDALVERVRAVAMDNRPSTPGSHIDWAGDDDEGLPDLDDWGVTASVGDKDETISPIIVDGLKPLPEPVAKPPTPSDGVKEEIAAPFVMENQSKQSQPAQTPLHPSLPPKPITGPIAGALHSGRGNDNLRSPAKPATASDTPVVPPPNGEPVKSSVDRVVEDEQDDGSDSGREGLAASIHAPTVSDSLSAPSNHTTLRNFNPTHNRAQTVGRVFPQTAPVNFNSRSRSGTSTPRGGGQHTRTHSSPPAGSVLGHRPSHSRPVITGDAISRLARTIAVSTPRTPPISASNI
ncbi:proline/serine-rich protein [Mycena vitilis]|nr:proline/serine-rich protein [Mycena vitilis]